MKISSGIFCFACIVLAVIFCLPDFSLIAQARGRIMEACAKEKAPVSLLEFPDIKLQIEQNFVRERFPKPGYYAREMSPGNVCAEFDFVRWYQFPEPVVCYFISPANLLADRSKVTKPIPEAINAADEKNDFSAYCCVVLFPGAKFREYGMVGLC